MAEMNHAERVEASQIPEKLLACLSTKELIDIVLDYMN